MLTEYTNDRLESAGVFTYPIDVPRTAGLMEAVGKAVHALGDLAEQECLNNEESECRCEVCQAREAIKAVEAALIPEHRTLNPERLSHAPEEIFFRRWVEKQKAEAGVNGGWGLLELLLSPTRIRRDNFIFDTHRPFYVPPITKRDAEVAATVVQWLGTSCGRCFIEECEREIVKSGKDRHDFDQAHHKTICQPDRILPRDESLARQAVAYFLRADDPKFDQAVRRVVGAIVAGRATITDGGLT